MVSINGHGEAVSGGTHGFFTIGDGGMGEDEFVGDL